MGYMGGSDRGSGADIGARLLIQRRTRQHLSSCVVLWMKFGFGLERLLQMPTRDRLSEQDVQYLIRMNEQLKKIEAFLRSEAAHIEREIGQRHVLWRDDPGGADKLPPHVDLDWDWLTDTELEVELTAWLREDDPAYDPEADNIVYCNEYMGVFLGIEDAGDDNWNEIGDPEHPLYRDRIPFCYLMHHLFFDSDLSIDQILRIGTFWVDVKSIRQRKYSLSLT